MAKKEEQVEVVEPEVVEETKAVAVKGPKENDIKKAITRQVATVQGVELRGNLEKLKLGAMVSEAVRILKLEDAAANRGRNSEGGGALGWWNDVCPKDESGAPVIPYKTVMMWKQAAENLPHLINRNAANDPKVPDTWKPVPSEKILALMAKNPKKIVGKDAKILASAEKAANGMTMRQMLLWGGDEPAPKSKGGRPKAEETDIPKRTRTEEAKSIWNVLLQQVTKTSVKDAIPLLPEKESQIAYDTLRDIADLLKKHLEEFSK